ncbi:WD40 repeat domain-containing serine/threonine protein kinase [Nonomuraea jiangxiensis]|uniref:WD domain-containing protein, G-beta repeat-containing protein n=1 Tax=Nonomuraea jiangxiensis TaxID=633440 RepID=A0A1G7ZBI3_9ACTN|nr:serine/threonine-protein kinase [Nonomuraea jiangxiensis]SDH05470.1 WD domain-containing protein, G-beta repeat-containing protein [Nonomuraea jiangxiensis]
MSRSQPGEDLGQIADYRITGFLGEGGQGAVYRGLSPSGGQVAIKVLHDRLSDDTEARRRFFRQVDLARRVAPFCTARVLDMGMHDERPYIVSEYVSGDSLERVVRRDGPRTGGGLERLAIATATALAAIHRAGVVHRDLKPGNVILGPEGPVVIDFGISRALDHTATMAGAVGTPGYMAPEQISGEQVGPAADVFSWAATMVFAATGRRAFAGESVPAVLHALLYDSPDLTGVPQSLLPLVTACLDKNPERRLSADDLVRTLTGDATAPVSPAPAPADGPTVPAPSPAPRPRRRLPRRALVAGGVAVCVAAAVLAVSLWAQPRGTTPVLTTATAATVADAIPALGTELGDPLAGHTNDVRAVAAVGSLDGVPITLTGSDDETARIWNLRTNQPIGRPLAGHTEWIRSVALDQLDGAPIAITGSDDGTARVWDLTTGKSRVLAGHRGGVKSVATGRIGGRHVAVTASADGTARVWDLRSGEEFGAPLTGHRGAVWAVAVAQIGGAPVAVTAGDDGTVRMWSLDDRKQLGEPMTGHQGWVRSVAIGNVAGKPVAITGSEDTTVRVWDLTTRKELGPPLAGHTGAVWSVAAANLGGKPVAVSGGEDKTVRVWDLTTRKPLGTPFTGHADTVWAVSAGLLDGHSIVVSGSRDQTARTWSLGG